MPVGNIGSDARAVLDYFGSTRLKTRYGLYVEFLDTSRLSPAAIAQMDRVANGGDGDGLVQAEELNRKIGGLAQGERATRYCSDATKPRPSLDEGQAIIAEASRAESAARTIAWKRENAISKATHFEPTPVQTGEIIGGAVGGCVLIGIALANPATITLALGIVIGLCAAAVILGLWAALTSSHLHKNELPTDLPSEAEVKKAQRTAEDAGYQATYTWNKLLGQSDQKHSMCNGLNDPYPNRPDPSGGSHPRR